MGLSYMWATADHPDPDGEQLRDVAKYLRWLQEAESDHKGKLVAVFWDWASLYQDKPFFDPRRTEEQTRMFKSGLQNVNLWYCHPNTLTLMNRKTPAGRQWSYDASGWPVSVRKMRGFWFWGTFACVLRALFHIFFRPFYAMMAACAHFSSFSHPMRQQQPHNSTECSSSSGP